MSNWQLAGGLKFESVEVFSHKTAVEAKESDGVVLSKYGTCYCIRSANSLVTLYGGAGRLIRSWQCPFGILELNFTDDLVLVICCDDEHGTIYLWDDLNLPAPRPFKDSPGKIRLGRVFASGVVILTWKMSLLVIKNLRNQPVVPWQPVIFPLVLPPRDLCILRPELVEEIFEVAISLPDQPGVLIASPQKRSVDARVPMFRALPSKILRPHPNKQILASIDLNDCLLVVNFLFDQILLAKDLKFGVVGFDAPPRSLDWIQGGGAGNALAVSWNETPWTTNLIHPHNDTTNSPAANNFGPGAMVLGWITSASDPNKTSVARFSFLQSSEILTTKSEIDGVRIMTNCCEHLIRRVGQSAISLSEGVNDNLEVLLDASKFELNHHKRMELLLSAQALKEKLQAEDGVNVKYLTELTNKFLECCTLARICYSSLITGISAITPLQLKYLSLPSFFCRTALCSFYEPAIAMSAYSNNMTDHVGALLAFRAKYKLSKKNDLTVDDITQVLVLDNTKNKRFESAASIGLYYKQSHRELAMTLIDNECSLAKKLMGLLHCHELEKILTLLDNSRGVDFDLKVRVVLECYNKWPVEQAEKFFLHPTAEQTLQVVYKSMRNNSKLEKMLISMSSIKLLSNERKVRAMNERGLLLAQTALASSNITDSTDNRYLYLEESGKEFESAGKSFLSTAVREYSKLEKMQRELLVAQQYIGRSLKDTIITCVAKGRDDVAERFRKVFAVKPLLFFRWRMKGMFKRQQYLEVVRWIHADREAAKYVNVNDVIEMCFEFPQAVSFIPKIAMTELKDNDMDKARVFVRLKMWTEALQFIQTSRCIDAANDMMAKCQNTDLKNKLKLILHEWANDPSLVSGETGSTSSSASIVGLVREQRCQQQ